MKGFRRAWVYSIAVILIRDAKRRVKANICNLKVIHFDVFVIFSWQKQCI